VLGCDGVIYPNLCQMEVSGHQSEAWLPQFHPRCAHLPESCIVPFPGSYAECEAYWYCNNAAPVSCRTLPNGFQQVVCGQEP
jgi:hypothetical protein